MDKDQPVNTTPPAESPITPKETATAPTPKNKSKKLIIGSILAGALVLLSGGGALAYTMWFQNPDRVVHNAVINAIQAKTVSMAGDIAIKAEGVNITLDLDTQTAENATSEMNVKAVVAIDTEDFKHTFNVDGSTRVLSDALYIKVNGIQSVVDEMTQASDFVMPSQAQSLIDKIDNQWISIKSSDYEDVSEEISEQQACFTELSNKIQSDKSIRKEIVQLYRDNQILVIKEELGTKSVNGTASLGYEVKVDTAAATAFVRELDNTTIGKEAKACSNEVDFGSIADDVAEAETASNDAAVELWVSRFGHEITEVAVSGSDESSSFDASLRPVFNKNISIEQPESAISLKDLLDDIQGMMFTETSSSQSDVMYLDLEDLDI